MAAKKEPFVSLMRYEYTVQGLIRTLCLDGWSGLEHSTTPVAGDLVILSAAPDSEWHLSIYIQDRGNGEEHLLESLRTGKMCWWNNVNIWIVSRKWVSERRCIKWTDAMFAFDKMFNGICRRADYYLDLPFIELLTEGAAVIGTRTRHNFLPVRTFSEPFDWKKMKSRELASLIAAQIKVHQNACAIDKAERLAKAEVSDELLRQVLPGSKES